MTPRFATILAVTAIALGLQAPGAQAQAPAGDTFDAVAATAVRVRRLEDVVWSLTATCDRGNDVQQRQCRLVRDHRAKVLEVATLLVDGDSEALELGTWSPQKKSMQVALTSCIRCAGIELDGRTWYLIGSGATARFDGGKLRSAVLDDQTRMFPDADTAATWSKIVRTAHVQYLIKVLPVAKRRGLVAGKDGLAFEIVGYRVSAPCDGAVIVAKPPSAKAEPDKERCSGSIIDGGAPDGVDALTAQMATVAMKPVVDAANACFKRNGISGRAKLELVIAGDGSVIEYKQTGDLVGTPTAQCIDTAMRDVTFPRSKKPRQKLGFPIILK
ncbi:MAG: hypothetical protein M3619_22025 [Myxococcota bacterium]|nr:hypothetical protein [Myxococcota bacterium]